MRTNEVAGGLEDLLTGLKVKEVTYLNLSFGLSSCAKAASDSDLWPLVDGLLVWAPPLQYKVDRQKGFYPARDLQQYVQRA